MRTKKVFLNSLTSVVGQAIVIFVSFVARYYFIQELGRTYLGINGLFTQILAMLSLVELGVGPAIIYSLYKPLAEKNYKDVAVIMKLYKKIYTIIGIVIVALGTLMAPFVHFFIKDDLRDINLSVIFILFVLNTAISYFYSYKQNLIIADQDKYIANINHYLFYFFLNIVQLILIVNTHNYYLFLVVQILITLLENISISIIADKRYPFLKEKCNHQVDQTVLKQIKKNTKAMIVHKIGGVAVDSTDNMIISYLLGIAIVGIYSNYTMVINALLTLIQQFFSAFTASVGNYGIKNEKRNTIELFETINLVNFMIYSVVSICCLCLFNDFIRILYGESMQFEFIIVLLIVFKFYLKGMRSTLTLFKEAFGLYWEDRYRPILETVLNLLFSVILTIKIGIAGVFIGTILSNLLSNLMIEPYIVFKCGLNESSGRYYVQYLRYLFVFLLNSMVLLRISDLIVVSSFVNLILKASMVFLLALCGNSIFFIRTKEFKMLQKRVVQVLKIKKKSL